MRRRGNDELLFSSSSSYISYSSILTLCGPTTAHARFKSPLFYLSSAAMAHTHARESRITQCAWEREREFPSSVEYDEEEGESFLRGKDKEKGWDSRSYASSFQEPSIPIKQPRRSLFFLRGIHFLFLGSLSQRLICICRNILRVLYEKQAFFQIWCLARYCVPGKINNLGLPSVFSWPKFLFGSQEAWINTVPPFSFTCVVFSIVKFITSESLSIAWTEESQSNGCMSFAFSLSFSLPCIRRVSTVKKTKWVHVRVHQVLQPIEPFYLCFGPFSCRTCVLGLSCVRLLPAHWVTDWLSNTICAWAGWLRRRTKPFECHACACVCVRACEARLHAHARMSVQDWPTKFRAC